MRCTETLAHRLFFCFFFFVARAIFIVQRYVSFVFDVMAHKVVTLRRVVLLQPTESNEKTTKGSTDPCRSTLPIAFCCFQCRSASAFLIFLAGLDLREGSRYAGTPHTAARNETRNFWKPQSESPKTNGPKTRHKSRNQKARNKDKGARRPLPATQGGNVVWPEAFERESYASRT